MKLLDFIYRFFYRFYGYASLYFKSFISRYKAIKISLKWYADLFEMLLYYRLRYLRFFPLFIRAFKKTVIYSDILHFIWLKKWNYFLFFDSRKVRDEIFWERWYDDPEDDRKFNAAKWERDKDYVISQFKIRTRNKIISFLRQPVTSIKNSEFYTIIIYNIKFGKYIFKELPRVIWAVAKSVFLQIYNEKKEDYVSHLYPFDDEKKPRVSGEVKNITVNKNE